MRMIRLSVDRSRGVSGTARADAGCRAEGLMALRLTHRRTTCSDGTTADGLVDGHLGGKGQGGWAQRLELFENQNAKLNSRVGTPEGLVATISNRCH
jgi:Spy/CpxP family protein refolding chaperone